MAVFDAAITFALNHLIRGESWAQERLRPHAGARVLLKAGPLDLHLLIDAEGLLLPGAATDMAEVTITLPADAPLKFLGDRKSLFRTVKLAGSADLAEALAFVFRNLHWDVEADLAHLVGDVAAHRLEMMRGSAGRLLDQSTRRLFGNFAEYASEDSGYLAPRREIEAFLGGVDALRDDLARLEKRLDRL